MDRVRRPAVALHGVLTVTSALQWAETGVLLAIVLYLLATNPAAHLVFWRALGCGTRAIADVMTSAIVWLWRGPL